jgi:peptidoglycan/xylan/chitin deacetylase (PgdA/CDA1 family)
LTKDGHYLGAHSNDHLLYCDWTKRDSLLVTRDSFRTDLQRNEAAMKPFGLSWKTSPFFLPPYEWYNDSIAAWTQEMGLTLVNNTPGTLSHTDYTGPADARYFSHERIFQSLDGYETQRPSGFNGFLLLFHAGAKQPRDQDFYQRLDTFLQHLKKEGYQFVRVDDLLR